VDVCEILLRYYKTDQERFRPVDRMIAHTGYLIFARPLLADLDSVFQQEPATTELEQAPGDGD
jgi:tRNA (adenine57-N1/adenine58-N1)-methyltransferase